MTYVEAANGTAQSELSALGYKDVIAVNGRVLPGKLDAHTGTSRNVGQL